MKKIILFFAVVLLAVVIGTTADAKNDKKYAPENEDAVENGVYDVEGRPDLKLRVFVYKAKLDTSPATALACLLPDNDSSAIVDGAGWKLDTSTDWVYKLNVTSVPASVGSGNLPTIATRAFSVWVDATGNKVSVAPGFVTTATRAQRDGQNIISWGRASGSTLAVTYIWYNTTTGKAVEIDTIMNQKFAWSWTDQVGSNLNCAIPNTYDAQNILTHELGHTFGLDDHYTSAYTNNTMYGFGSKTEVKKNTLTAGDIDGVKVLYP